MRTVMFTKNYLKKITLVLVIIACISLLLSIVLKEQFDKYYGYSMDENIIIAYADTELEYQYITIDVYDSLDKNEIVDGGIDLSKIQFIKDNSYSMRRTVQDLLNKKEYEIPQTYLPFADGKVFNDYSININLPAIDVDHLIIGKFPEAENEILISELLATYIMSNSTIKSYKDIINATYQEMKVVGVYQELGLTKKDEIIMYSSNTERNKAQVITSNNRKIRKELATDDISYMTNKDVKKFNVAIFTVLLYFIVVIIVSLFTLKKEINQFIRISECGSISTFMTIINISIPFLVYILVSLLIMFI